MRLFHSLDTMDWGRVLLIMSAVGTFWAGLVSVVPEKYHKVGTVILGSVLAAVTVMMRSGKSRVEKIEEKVEEFKAEGIKKREEILELISNEAAEKEAKKEEKK